MKPTHFELMTRAMARSLNMDDIYSHVCQYLNCLDGALEFGEKTEKGQEVTLKNMDLFTKKLGKLIKTPNDMKVYRLLDHAMFGIMSNLLINLFKFNKYGQKTFNFCSGLTELLHTTDLAGTYEFLKAPYPSFYMNFEGCPIWIDYGEDHEQVAGVYVDSTRDDIISFLAISRPSSDYLGGSIWIKAYAKKNKPPDKKISIDDFNFGGATKNPAIELAVKAILYLNSEKPDIKSGEGKRESIEKKLKKAKKDQKIKRLKKQLLWISATDFVDVGSSIHVPKNKKASQEKVQFTGGFHLNYRFWVRGHFKHQAYGPKLSKRKLIWIAPYMKGPDQAEIIHKKYSIGK